MLTFGLHEENGRSALAEFGCGTRTPEPQRDTLHFEHVLEISRAGLFKALDPDTTVWVRWGPALTADEPHQPSSWITGTIAGILAARRTERSFIVVPAIHPDHKADQSRPKLLAKSILEAGSRSIVFSRPLNLLIKNTKHVIVDLRDERDLCEATLRLFPRASLYFKRELDLDQSTDSVIGSKLRPLPLFLPDDRWTPSNQEKDIDVFFAGALTNEIRVQAVNAANALAHHGFRVIIPSSPLPYSEFMDSLARAWLVLSPEGYGWDCYRHYEACLAASVPVINRPRYRRPLYLQEGLHCFYYDADHDSLVDRLLGLLSDKARLRRMGELGRRHVLANHTRSAVARHILSEVSQRMQPL